jgi:integrase
VLQGVLQRAVEWGRLPRNAARVVRKPSGMRERAVAPLAPAAVEAIRDVLLERGRLRDATLVSVLAYAGTRPQEALALSWRNVRERTLLVEEKAVGGEVVAGQKTKRRARSVDLMLPLRQDLAQWRLASGRPEGGLVFPDSNGNPWHTHDWQNWTRRVWHPAAKAAGLGSPRPYDLRHSFASLRIRAGDSIPELAEQLGHSPQMTLSTYAHIIRELKGLPPISAEEQVMAARRGLGGVDKAV